MAELPVLSLPEWVVLTLVDESPAHGFAVAALTGVDGDVGRAWQVPRPVVYRSLDRLIDLGLVRPESTEAGHRGPQRSIVATTPAGRKACRAWLARPVSHIRDVRSELLVKLGLLARRSATTESLIAAQKAVFVLMQDALEKRVNDESDFGWVLARWRAENVRAALRFLDDLGTPPSAGGRLTSGAARHR
jgi:DNA-binding PadR family transcriptional regulator